MRPDYMAVMFAVSGVMSFNAGIWQILRRGQKSQLLENHLNLNKPPITELPPPGSNFNDYEFRPVEFDGTLDNEGSCLVGPRSLPSYKGASHIDEEKGGFLVMTPFEIANSGGQFVMVNRGWVPIEAGKHRTMLVQYIGEGFAPLRLHGILRKEEFISASLWSDSPDNDGPVATDLSWLAMRPWNMAVRYYRRRWNVPPSPDPRRAAEEERELVAAHGAHHYYVEMIEDFSGDDQRVVRDHVWPWRRGVDEITYVHLTPIVHTMYVCFWFSVTAASLYGMRHCWLRQKEIFRLRRVATESATRVNERRQAEAAAYLQSVEDVQRLQAAHTAHLSAGSGAAAGAAGAGAASSKPANGNSDKK